MSRVVFGVDIGGTTVKMGCFSAEGELKDNWEIPTRTEQNGENILPDVAKSIEKYISENNISGSDVEGIGIGVPGPVDDSGVIHKAVNLGWGVFNINEKMEKLSGFPVVAGNDANVAALGEMWKGGARGYEDVVLVTLGTGIGGGIIVKGKILSGSTGAGGEIGHIHINDNETQSCGCGNKGCLEQYGSATGIARIAREMLKGSTKDSVLRNTDPLDAKAVFDAVKEGDELAKEIAAKFGEYLGTGLAAIACVVNPEVICIGGGVSKAGEVLIDYIKPSYLRNVFHGSRDVGFVMATLGNDAGIYGAAKFLLDKQGK